MPNAYLSWRVASKWWLGLGVNVPFGLETDWEGDWVGRFHEVQSKVETLNINPTVAVKLSDSFSLGAGVNYQQLKATLSQNAAYGGLSFAGAVAAGAAIGGPAVGAAAGAAILAQPGGPAGLTRDGLADIEGDTWSWGWNVGAHAKLGEQGRLGVTYRSKVEHDLEGDAVFNEAPTFSTAGPFGAIECLAQRALRPGTGHDQSRAARNHLGRGRLPGRQGRGAGGLDLDGLELDPGARHRPHRRQPALERAAQLRGHRDGG